MNIQKVSDLKIKIQNLLSFFLAVFFLQILLQAGHDIHQLNRDVGNTFQNLIVLTLSSA